MPTGNGDSLLVYPALKNNEIVGYAVNSNSNNGFSGRIDIMVGFDTQSKVINYAVLSHAETPGLGSKMGEWFKNNDKPKQSIIGKDLSKRQLHVSSDGGDIDAITASTITSRAFLEAVNKAYAAYMNSDAETSATSTNKNNEKKGDNSNE